MEIIKTLKPIAESFMALLTGYLGIDLIASVSSLSELVEGVDNLTTLLVGVFALIYYVMMGIHRYDMNKHHREAAKLDNAIKKKELKGDEEEEEKKKKKKKS